MTRTHKQVRWGVQYFPDSRPVLSYTNHVPIEEDPASWLNEQYGPFVFDGHEAVVVFEEVAR